MDIFFHDPSDIPLPPEEVHIRKLAARPYPDGRRVRVTLEISPFQKRPSAEIRIQNAAGHTLASVTIIETIDPRMEMTLHLRGPQTVGEHIAKAELFYEEIPPLDEDGPTLQQRLDTQRTPVDQAEFRFEIGSKQ